MALLTGERSPGQKLAFAILIGLLLAVPLFSVWLINYDRQQQSNFAKASIAEGWGGPQVMAGPLLVIPYRTTITETVEEANRPVVRSRQVWQELILSPELVDLATRIHPERRQRSIYEVVVYEAEVSGNARFAMPADLSRFGVAAADMALDRAELRFGISDPRGLFGRPPRVRVGGTTLGLQPGGGTAATSGAGFFAWLDAAGLAGAPINVSFAFDVRGNGWLSLAPQAGDTQWRLTSSWPHPSFQGGFLPVSRNVSDKGFTATYRVGNLALGQSLVSTGTKASPGPLTDRVVPADPYAGGTAAPGHEARVSLIQPVDLYSQVNRSAKYGFLFIGFTFLAFLLFDVIGGVRVSAVEYLLVGAALVLFFIMLLAFAEVIGFTPAYILASAAIVGLNTAYSAAVLKSWRRAGFICALLIALYVVLYILLSLEAFSLLIGSLMLFVALAAVMYVTRNLNWGARDREVLSP
ncbi:cell envelope integrity protein CreD [Sphingosinicella rhizophila]|uniref:Cell envelope integrity protein CreD n=1 Tax=Sphingosinicella rhizophila TaxID=3050082 RepID=A0ABU3Q3S8_9SPHN|nr:cell envelope integrity protein CreD [Sphingosinicella sp. GR2756]MDT9597932.1 cell envelope integrity protein CreD [Sphingosinicella sp. GR2756]